SRGGVRIATVRPDKLYVWEVPARKKIKKIAEIENKGSESSASFRRVRFGPDDMLATTNDNYTMQVWEVDSGGGKERLRIPDAAGGPWDFSPDWRYIAVARASPSGFLVYPLDAEELIDLAARQARRPLSRRECKRYLSDRPCSGKRAES
ncbi:MAG: hypothetical protein ACRDJK_12335, partial [Actinomycetota bacterium]